MADDNKNYVTDLPIGSLALMPLKGTEPMAHKISDYIREWRKEQVKNNRNVVFRDDYIKDDYIIYPEIDRFGTGEAKGVINDTIRGADLFLIVDVVNYNVTYKMYGVENRMSPDDHYQDLKRVIAAANGKAKRVNVIMPFLYESRQHKRTKRESLDCALMLKELATYGISNLITIDAHDPRVMNAIPLNSFDSLNCHYQFVKTLLDTYNDITIDKDHLVVISPDVGGMTKAIQLANMLSVNIGFLYKRRDYSRVVDGTNPIVEHTYMGVEVDGKDCIIMDDMIASGESLVDTAKKLKNMGAKRVFACMTFGLFTKGLQMFDKAVEEKVIDKVFTTNTIYQTPELLSKPWYVSVDMTEYLARVIESINHDSSISQYLDPNEKVKNYLENYKNK